MQQQQIDEVAYKLGLHALALLMGAGMEVPGAREAATRIEGAARLVLAESERMAGTAAGPTEAESIPEGEGGETVGGDEERAETSSAPTTNSAPPADLIQSAPALRQEYPGGQIREWVAGGTAA